MIPKILLKLTLTTLFAFTGLTNALYSAELPELMYFKFDESGSTVVENHADPSTAVVPSADVVGGVSIGGTGQFGHALIGAGNSGEHVNTGYTDDITGSWTISFWLDDFVPGGGTNYFCCSETTDGDNFRIFTGGVADDYLLVRTTGTSNWTDIEAQVQGSGPFVVHFVHDESANELRSYINGVPDQVESLSGPLHIEMGTNFVIGDYGTADAMNAGTRLDEFRFYNRALTDQEIANTWNIELGMRGPLVAAFYAPDTVYTGSNVHLRSQTDESADHAWYVNGQLMSNENNFIFNPQSAGTYDIRLDVSDDDDSDTYTRTIVVIDTDVAPEPDFFAERNILIPDADTIPFFAEVKLWDLSDKGPSSWHWEIDPQERDVDGNSEPTHSFAAGYDENAQNPELYFHQPGLYDVTLTAENQYGADSITKEDYILVSHLMCPPHDGSGISTDMKGILTDNGGGLAYGEADNCGFVIDPCTDNAFLVVEDFALECNTDFLRVYDGTDDSGEPLFESCQDKGLNGFTGSPLQDCDQEDICLPPDTLFSETGAFYVEFESGENDNNLNGFRLSWDVPEKVERPQASFEAPDTVCINTQTFFENTSTGASIDGYAWDYLGNDVIDDFTHDGQFTFVVPDIYTVKLFAFDCAGQTDTFEHEVVAIDPEDPAGVDIYASQQNIWQGERVELGADITGCVSEYEWSISPEHYSFVENTDASSSSPVVEFNAPGCFDVQLTASNSAGETVVIEECLINVQEYCQPLVGQAIEDVGVNRIELVDFEQNRNTGEARYTNYTGEGIVAELAVGETYQITLTRNTTSNDINRRVWIDYNHNGSFEDSLELVAEEVNSLVSTFTANFTVPGHAKAGETRLRIGSALAGSELPPCGGQQIAEYLDYAVYISPDVNAPELTLLGDNPMNLEVFDTYAEPGAEAWDPAYGDLTHLIEIDASNLNTNEVGNYNVYYAVEDPAGNTAEKERLVIVEDKQDPEIELLGDSVIEVEVHSVFEDPGVDYWDHYWDADDIELEISGSVDMSELGTYELTYCVTDGSGNGPVCVSRTVQVVDTTPPEINLPSEQVTTEVNEQFELPDIEVTDNYWSEEALDVSISGMQSYPSELGTFEVEITATDGSGNTSTRILEVEVVDTTPPEISLRGATQYTLDRYESFDDPGVEVSDNYDDSPEIIRGGTFEGTDKPGLYNRTYHAVDQSGNKSVTVERMIRVRDVVSSIEDTDEGVGITMYPNPASEQLTIKLKGIEGIYSIEVHDLSGRFIASEHTEPGERVKELDLSTIDAGMYLISVKGPEGHITTNRITVVD